MIKLEHFSNDGFDSYKFLILYNPNEDVKSYHDGELKSEYIKNFHEYLKELNFKQLGAHFYKNNVVIKIVQYSKSYYLHIHYISSFDCVKFLVDIDAFLKKDVIEDLPKINMITIRNGDPDLREITLKKRIDIDLENSYNLSYSLNNIMSDIKSDKSGLMLFTGLPGTGKSSLIKYLSQENKDLKFCYIQNSNLDVLSNPNFLDFCLDELQGSVIVLEDCEKALMSRDLNTGFDISNILNLTDGFIGDVLNIKIIATLNTTDKIDTALLRKGRLICRSDFKKLTVEQGTNLAKKLNRDIVVKEELQLCEIYNTDDNGGVQITPTSVGFKM